MFDAYNLISLINQSRLGQQGKSKEEQVSKVKQIEPDYSKQKLMDQKRQDSVKQSTGVYSKLM